MKEKELKGNHKQSSIPKDKTGVLLGVDVFTGKQVFYDKKKEKKHLVLGRPR